MSNFLDMCKENFRKGRDSIICPRCHRRLYDEKGDGLYWCKTKGCEKVIEKPL